MYCVKDGTNERLSNYRNIERLSPEVMAYKPGVFISLSKALTDKVITNNGKVIEFFNENKSSALLVGKINEKGDFVPNEDFSLVVAVGKINGTYPQGYPKLSFTISIPSKNQKIEEQIKEKFAGNNYFFDFQYHPEQTFGVNDNVVEIIMPEDAFSHLSKVKEEKVETNSGYVKEEITNSTVNSDTVTYKYVRSEERRVGKECRL